MEVEVGLLKTLGCKTVSILGERTEILVHLECFSCAFC